MTSRALILLITLLSCFAFAYEDHGIGCNHHNEKVDPGFLDVDEAPLFTEDRMLASGSSMRLYPHFDTLRSGSSAQKSYIRYDLVPAVVSYFGKALRVRQPIQGRLKVDSSVKKMCEESTPSILFSSGVDADHFVLISAGYESGSFAATSMPCYLSTTSKRPIVSRVKFNLNMLDLPNGDQVIHERNLYLVMHEMVHSFGFSGDLFQYYMDESGNKRTGHIKTISLQGKKRTVIDVPVLTNRIRKHFGCSSLPGAYLENDGDSTLTSGSHFERKFFLMDVMTSGILDGRRLSEFTLAMLEASGWYSPNYDFAEPNHFGKGQGCGFVNNKCSGSKAEFDEFCGKTAEIGCFASGRGGGKCASDAKSEGCKYYVPKSAFDCDNPDAKNYLRLPELQVFGRGSGSKCFNGDLSNKNGDKRYSFCFKYSCSGSGSGTTLTVKVGSDSVTCKKQGKVSIEGYEGGIECPDPLTFCQTVGKEYCPRNCMGRGTCSGHKCVCNKGYKGADCSFRT